MSDASSEAESQVCNTCGESKPLRAFKTNGLKKDGTRYRMKKCRSCMDAGEADKELVVMKSLDIVDRILKYHGV